MTAFTLALVSVVLLAGFIASWMTMIKQVQLEKGRWLLRLLAGTSMVVAGLAFALGVELFGGILAGVAMGVSILFLVLSSLSRQSSNTPAVAVGQPMLEFSAPDENGEIFDSASLSGKPILLKFFRGHW